LAAPVLSRRRSISRPHRYRRRRSVICSRAPQFSPRAPDEQIEQQQMSKFDAEQRKLDEQLDKSLNICRC
jgi:hypothetical protein